MHPRAELGCKLRVRWLTNAGWRVGTATATPPPAAARRAGLANQERLEGLTSNIIVAATAATQATMIASSCATIAAAVATVTADERRGGAETIEPFDES